MKSRIYYLLLAAVTATFLTACDRNDSATDDAPATGSAGGTGAGMESTTGVEGTTTQDPAAGVPADQSQDAGATGSTDPNTPATNP